MTTAASKLTGRPTWVELDGPPDLPDTLPHMQAHPGAFLAWYATDGPDQERVYAAVGGDSGAEGAYVLGLWVLPPAGVDSRAWSPRYPTFEEWTALANAACIPGAILSCSFPTGATEMVEPPEGRALFITQTGAIAQTPAGQRWALANPGGLLDG